MGRIDVLALGWQEDDMTLGAVKRLRAAERIILRTERCGAADYLRREGIEFETFDALYDLSDDFDELAERVAEALHEAAQAGDVLYGVNDPGDQKSNGCVPPRRGRGRPAASSGWICRNPARP